MEGLRHIPRKSCGVRVMAIPVHHEGEDVVAEFPHIIEQCHFCREQTRYWHENTNNPVCQGCAKAHRVSELPDWGRAIRANKRKAKASAKPTNAIGGNDE